MTDADDNAPDDKPAPKRKGAGKAVDIIPEQGQRALLVGQTGSGKTEFAVWLLERMKNSPIVIYDTKGESKFEMLPRSRLVRSGAALYEAIDDASIDYIVFRVPPEIVAEPDDLDGLLWDHFQNLRGADVYIDELFSFTQNGKAGPGLVALLTQGRSLGFSTIMSAQRPSWLSRFTITEAQHYYLFYLVDKKDKARLGDVIPGFADLPEPPEFGFYYYRTRDRAPRLMAPILLDKGAAKGYKPVVSDPTPDAPDSETSLNWL